MVGDNIIFAKHSYGKELISKICKQLKIQMFKIFLMGKMCETSSKMIYR